ncbi:MAG: hypothetical protein M3Y81_17060 [Chloroflexota bacterium]|nr:hypothetical protein [Chloroflexota bacterium]
MSELRNFPFKNQLNSPTLDGHPDENRGLNCVPSSIAAGLQYLTGKPFEPDELKDTVYGQSYRGGTSALAFVSYVATHGIRLFPINGSGAYLVQMAHQHLALGHPVIITEPDPYGHPGNGLLHVVVFYKDLPGALVAMDPFGATSKQAPDALWAARIDAAVRQIWIMEKQATTSANVPQGWHDDGTTLTAPNGNKVVKGFRQYVLAHAWHPENLPLENEHAVHPLETAHPALGSGNQQVFRQTVLEWTPQRNVFEMWTGLELLALRAKISELQSPPKPAA